MTSTDSSFHTFVSQAETENFARTLSLWAKPSLVIALTGDLGSGKSTFARAFIQALAKQDEVFDIPSPTFPIIQTYDNTRVPVAHVDLYRLTKREEIDDLGIIDLLSTHIILIEWPALIQSQLPLSTLSLTFSGQGDTRRIEMSKAGDWNAILDRNALIENFIARSQWKDAARRFFEGDASSRRYESLNSSKTKSLLMDMPKRPDGPAVKDGKPYSAIAHLAEGITAVVGINTHLKQLGYSAPMINDVDITNGIAIIEMLEGKVFSQMMREGLDMNEPLATAVELLADMASKRWPNSVELEDGSYHTLAAYDTQAQLIEVDLLPSWFWPHIHSTKADAKLNQSFAEIWQALLQKSHPKIPQWVLRDYHSPNLIWINKRQGIERIGLIDTQDAVMGHPAYDLASLLQDARVDIDFDFAERLYQLYVQLRMAQGSFDQDEFAKAYAILGAQRATKILGIFARLNKRDNKPTYLKHMPRVSRYLSRNLEHPTLAPLKDWYKSHLPEALSLGML